MTSTNQPGTKIRRILGNSLFKQTLTYGITDGINKALPFILFPILAAFLTPVDYGILSNYFVLVQILTILSGLTAGGSLSSIWYRINRDQSGKYIFNQIIIISLICLVLIILVLLFQRKIEEFTSINLYWQITTVLIACFSNITLLQMTVWRLEEQAIKYGVYQILQTLAVTVPTFLLIVVYRWNWEGRTISYFYAVLVFGLVSLFILRRKRQIKFRYSKAYIGEILRFGLPLLPHGISAWLKTGVDKLLLTNFFNLNENGLYSTALTFTSIFTLVVTSFNNAYLPFLFKRLSLIESMENKLHEKVKLVKMTYILFAGLAVLVGLAYIFSRYFILLFFKASYGPSLKYLLPLMVAAFFQGTYLLIVNYIFYTRKTNRLGLITFSSSLVQIALSFLLLHVIGPVGVAWSSALVSFLTFVLVWIHSARTYDMPWKLVAQSKRK